MKKYTILTLVFFLYSQNAIAQEFALDTTKTMWHEPATGSNHKALIKENLRGAPTPYHSAKKSFRYDIHHPYCRENRRAIDLVKNESNYAYVRWRGGLYFQYNDCQSGDKATFKARANRVHFEYKKTF